MSWYLRYALSYSDIEEMLLERGMQVDHSTINRRVLTYAPAIERRLHRFRRMPFTAARTPSSSVGSGAPTSSCA